jgi:hypothetical protein
MLNYLEPAELVLMIVTVKLLVICFILFILYQKADKQVQSLGRRVAKLESKIRRTQPLSI